MQGRTYLKSLLTTAVVGAGWLAAAGSASAQSSCGNAATTVWTSGAKTQAAVCGAPSPSNGTIYSYLGIPYAAQQPIGANRWTASAVAAWPPGTPYQALKAGNICPQGVSPWVKTPPAQGEDCLYLNVWAPSSAVANPGGKMPVMVFIHGGAFVEGGGSLPMYDGTALAANGVIVVTLNYRLGSLGFLAATVPPTANDANGAPTILSGNFGLQDQQNALKWVQSNIAAFGGDPAQVTIFGESAGAMSVGLHLFAMPGSNGPGGNLFQAAMMESNPLGSVYRTQAEAQAEGGDFVAKLCKKYVTDPDKNCPGTISFSWLQSLSASDILAAESGFLGLPTTDKSPSSPATAGSLAIGGMLASGTPNSSLPWSPNVDNQLIVSQPLAGFNGTAMKKPFVIGFNQDEGNLFAAMAYDLTDGTLVPPEYRYALNKVFGDSEAATITGYNYTVKKTKTYPYSAPAANPAPYYNGTATTLAGLINDFGFRCGNLWAISQVSGQTGAPPIYGYYFTQKPAFDLYRHKTLFSDAYPDLPACAAGTGGVCHANELPYVFNTVQYAFANDPDNAKKTLPNGDKQLAATMNAAWAAFAKTPSNPQNGWVQLNGTGGSQSLRQWNSTTSTAVALSTLDGLSNCSAFWNGQGLYPKAATTTTQK